MTIPIAICLLLTPPLLGVAAVGVVHNIGDGDGIAEIAIAAIAATVTPLVGALIWLIKRQERESLAQTKRRDKLLMTQVLMLRRLGKKIDMLPARLAKEVRAAIGEAMGGNSS